MKRLTLFVVVLLISTAAFAQNWKYVSVFPDTSNGKIKNTVAFLKNAALHGLATDPEGKVWIHSYYASDSIAVNAPDGTPVLTGLTGGKKRQATRVLYCFNADGTQASFSPIFTADYTDNGVAKKDTLGGHLYNNKGVWTWDPMTGRGLGNDEEGNILASYYDKVYRFDYKTGKCTGRIATNSGASLTTCASDKDGNIFVGFVAPGNPIKIYDKTMNFKGDANFGTDGTGAPITKSSYYGRVMYVSSVNGTTYFARAQYSGPTGLTIRKYDEFGSCDSVSAIPGICPEAFGVDRSTGYLWMNAGNKVDPVAPIWSIAKYPYTYGTYYGYDMSNPLKPVLKDSLTWSGDLTSNKPRGIAFSQDGQTAYAIAFQVGKEELYCEKFSKTIANETVPTTVAKTYSLAQNYPNPFNPSTKISFTMPQSGIATLKVYNMLGQEVATLVNTNLAAGAHSFDFNASNLSSGTYMYQLKAGSVTMTKKMMLVK